jgi:hypothetical protein
LTVAESHYADVLRSVIPPFVRDVLDGAADAAPTPAAGGPLALLVTGTRRTASDEAVTELLQRQGYAVRCAATTRPDFVVVTRGAGAAAVAAVARVGAPLLAWHGFVPLGLAGSDAVLVARDHLCIADQAGPLAAGLTGEVPVYRGRAAITVADAGPEARVVARVPGDERAAVFHYPAGARLADGTTAPAPRIGVHLAGDGMAPWLMTAEGRAIIAAAVPPAA